MCGIAGVISNPSGESKKDLLSKMIFQFSHRGPDSSGVWESNTREVSLGHRRLAIIDTSNLGQQPFVSKDNRFIVAYNGEIYNYIELRKECEKLGSQFKSNTDTEVLIECYRHYKHQCVHKLRGMWAFILYDKVENKVFMGRDPFGIKPLYYSFYRGSLFFSSEIKGFFPISNDFLEEDEATSILFEKLGLIDREDWTFYKLIKRFPHGSFSSINLNDEISENLKFTKYWSPPKEIIKINEEEAAEELKTLFTSSVKKHLRSDVPIASCLSGGLDSSAIVSIASQEEQLTTFTSTFPENPEIDESSWAKIVIDHSHVNPKFITPTFSFFKNNFWSVLHAQDEPFGSTSIFSQFAIYHGISKHNFKVALDGQGADEQLAGYHGFFPYYFTHLYHQGNAFNYFLEALQFQKNYKYSFLKNLIKYFRNRKYPCPKYLLDLNKYSPKLKEVLEHRLEKVNLKETNFEQTLSNLVHETNLPALLRYSDRNSMYHSLEIRVPFLETDLVNFILSLPAGLRIKKGLTKYIFRKAMSDILPKEVNYRLPKLGFPAPEKDWLSKVGIQSFQAGGYEWRKFILKKWQDYLVFFKSNSRQDFTQHKEINIPLN